LNRIKKNDYLKFISTCLLIIILISCHSQATDYYIDSQNGRDGNDGRNPTNPWKSLAKINSTRFKAGDRILLKAGEIWHEKLLLVSSGTPENPIIFTSYGNGAKPVIAAWDTITGWSRPRNWSNQSQNLWYISCPQNPKRIWLSDNEFKRSKDLAGVDSTARWFFNETDHQLYIYSNDNPALHYSKVMAAAVRDAASIGRGVSDVIIRDLSFQGGGLYSLHLNDCQQIQIENCEIGTNSGKYGILVSQSNHGVIRNCLIDSGLRLKYDFEYYAVEDGLKLYSGCNYWKIFNNRIQDWGHSGIQIQSQERKFPTSHNEIFQNTISAKNVAYCRGFEVAGPDGSCQYNKIYRNYIAETSVRNQILGDHNSIYYNIIHTLRNVPYRTDGTAQAFSFSNHEGNTCHHNQLFNNVIYDSDEPAIILRSHDGSLISYNQIINNIICDCGRKLKDMSAKLGLLVEDNQKIAKNTFQNNNFFNSREKDIISYRGKVIAAAQFNQQTGNAGDLVGQNLQHDPLFIDLSNYNFELKVGSPCIDAGQDVHLSEDFNRKPVPQGKGVDMGAYEFSEK
jgi:hypothetical protein